MSKPSTTLSTHREQAMATTTISRPSTSNGQVGRHQTQEIEGDMGEVTLLSQLSRSSSGPSTSTKRSSQDTSDDSMHTQTKKIKVKELIYTTDD